MSEDTSIVKLLKIYQEGLNALYPPVNKINITVKNLYESGLTMMQVAKELSISITNVSKRLKTLGVKNRKKGKETGKYRYKAVGNKRILILNNDLICDKKEFDI